MKTAISLLTALLSSAPLALFCQSTTPENQPYIEVTGTAEKEVVPDEIYIGIILKEKYVNKAKVTIEAQEQKLKEAIQSLGIAPDRLFLSDADASYVKINWKTKDVLTQKDYALKVSDAATVGKVFQELDKLEITDASILKVSHTKMDSLRKEVKILAIKAAKEKAAYLLAAIGEQVGKPLMITEIEMDRYYTGMESNISNPYYFNETKVENQQTGEVQFQKIKIQSGISARFSIQ